MRPDIRAALEAASKGEGPFPARMILARRYLEAITRYDWRAIEALWAEAETRPELATMLHTINAALYPEGR